jgi:hypothetical protein
MIGQNTTAAKEYPTGRTRRRLPDIKMRRDRQQLDLRRTINDWLQNDRR